MDHIEDMRKNVTLQEHEVINVHSTDFPDAYYGYNDNWDFDKFKELIKKETKETIDQVNQCLACHSRC